MSLILQPFLGAAKRFLTYMLCFFFLPQSLGNSQREYEKHVLLYSIRNQLRFRNNLGESGYFTELLLLLFKLLN